MKLKHVCVSIATMMAMTVMMVMTVHNARAVEKMYSSHSKNTSVHIELSTDTGDIVLMRGHTNVAGAVHGDVIMYGGTLDLGTNAVVEGDVITLNTAITIHTNAVIKGDLITVVGTLNTPKGFKPEGELIRLPRLANAVTPSRSCYSLRSARTWMLAAGGFLFMVLLGVLFPRAVQGCTDTACGRPWVSLFVGFISLLMVGPVCLLLVISLIGILLLPIFLMSLAVAMILGIAGIYRCIGGRVGRLTGSRLMEKPWASLLVGTLLVGALLTVPILSWVALGLLFMFGLGAASLALAGRLQRKNLPPTLVVVKEAGAEITAQQPEVIPSLGGMDPTSLPRVGFWVRVGAGLIDLLLLSIASKTIPILLLIYIVAMWTWKGTTIGGMVFGFKVVRVNGQPLTFGVALVRGLACMLSLVALGLGFFWIAWDREKQSWHDKIAGTYVVRMPKGVSLV